MSVSNIERFNFSLIQRPAALVRGCTSYRISRQVVPVRIRLFGKLFLPMLVVVLFACKSSRNSTIYYSDYSDIEGDVFTIVEEMPLYDSKPAGEEVSRYISSNLIYPAEAKEKGITGLVLVDFIIDENGNLINVKIIRSVHPLLDAEALRVFQSLPPKWTPGKQKGKPVKVKFLFPVNFKL